MTTAPQPLPSFIDLHKNQLEALGFPPALYGRLQEKLEQEIFDAGGLFKIVEDEEGQRQVICTATEGVEAGSDVFLVDHAYSFQLETYRQDLDERPELIERLAAMMSLSDKEEEEQEKEEAEAEATAEEDEGKETPAATADTLDETDLRFSHPDPEEKPSLYEKLTEQIWRYCASYRLQDPRDPFKFRTVWFVNDEFGSAFRHAPSSSSSSSGTITCANFRLSPFVYLPPSGGGTIKGAIAFSLAWPVAKIEEGDECTRDFAFGSPDDSEAEDTLLMKRAARLATWFDVPKELMDKFGEGHARKMAVLEALSLEAKESNTIAAASSSSSSSSLSMADTHFSRTFKHKSTAIKLYADNLQVTENVTRPEFVHVSSPGEADVVWVYHQSLDKAYREKHGLGKDVVLSQTEGDECLVFKHLLPLTAARCGPSYREWLPLTFNMETEAGAFVWEYKERQRQAKEKASAQGQQQQQQQPQQLHRPPPYFILKPFNLGRSLDTAVTDSLPQALRGAETCPKIACEYVHDIATVMGGKKFDVRYRLMVRSWAPLELFRWTHWGLRVSNHDYSLAPKDVNDFQSHFTVVDYAGYVQRAVNEEEFVASFQQENGGVPWKVVDEKVDKIIKELFVAAAPLILEAAGSEEEARRLCSFYGVDVMVTRDLQPKLLECTFGPDCAAAVKMDKDFYNKAFGVLFLGEECEEFRML